MALNEVGLSLHLAAVNRAAERIAALGAAIKRARRHDPFDFGLYARWIIWWTARSEALDAQRAVSLGHRGCDWDVEDDQCEVCGEACEYLAALEDIEAEMPETDQDGPDLSAIVAQTPRGRWLRRRIRRAIRSELAKAPGLVQEYALPTLELSAPLLGPGARELGYPRIDLRGMIARPA